MMNLGKKSPKPLKRNSLLKQGNTLLRRSPLNKRSVLFAYKLEELNSQFKEDKEFYKKIWETRKHICFETGKSLGKEPLITFFHHVLPKEFYPQYRHEEWNIVLLRPDIHNQAETTLEMCPKVYAYKQELLNKIKKDERN